MRVPPLLAALAALSVPVASQQFVLAQNDGPSYGNYAVGWPSSVIAFKFTPTQAITLAAAQVFTGNQTPAPHSVEIRTRDAVTGLPAALVGQPGTWQSLHVRCWQGAAFAQPAALAANTDYFLVWRVQGMFPQHSVAADANPGNVLSEVRYSDGSTWHAQAMAAAKFRLFTAYAAGTAQAFGTGKPGGNGTPSVGVSGWPAVGNPLDVWLDDAPRVASTAPPNAILMLGWPIPGGVVWPFGTQWTTADAVLLLQTRSHTSPFVGAISHSVWVPNLPVLAGLTIAVQWGVLDPAAADGISHTAAVAATIQ